MSAMGPPAGDGDPFNVGEATFAYGGAEEYEEYPYTAEDDAMLDEIEREIEAQQHPATTNTNTAVKYTDLPPHAEEFWFPECRECSCCKGFKHGCQCCAKEGMRSCKCAPSTGPTAPVATAPPPAPAAAGGWVPTHPGVPPPQQQHHQQQQQHGYAQPYPPQQHQQPYYGGGGGYPGGDRQGGYPPQQGGYGGGGRGGGGRGGGRGYGGGGRGGGYGGRGGGGNLPMCRFFNSPGGCRFGDSCRFSHGY